ncbi:MAG: T9SS type A sorting domain-containing protein, partial [Actinomycetia bacterium]|nr:T9SS type A sorting domain-containing protein [Actinomycetes bacterium]
ATSIRFALSDNGHVRLTIYDTAGRRVRELVNEYMAAGEHGRIWNGRDDSGRRVVSGVYSYRLEANGLVQTKRLVVVR